MVITGSFTSIGSGNGCRGLRRGRDHAVGDKAVEEGRSLGDRDEPCDRFPAICYLEALAVPHPSQYRAQGMSQLPDAYGLHTFVTHVSHCDTPWLRGQSSGVV